MGDTCPGSFPADGSRPRLRACLSSGLPASSGTAFPFPRATPAVYGRRCVAALSMRPAPMRRRSRHGRTVLNVQNPTSDSHAILARLLRALEVPDCNCPAVSYCSECGASSGQPCVPSCSDCELEWPEGAGQCPRCGCEECVPCPRQGKERPPPLPCRHVREHWHDAPYQEWQALLWVSDEEYGQPDAAVFPTPCLPGSEGKVAVMAERHNAGESLWHPKDGEVTRNALDSEGIRVSRGKNGAIHRGGLQQQRGKAVRNAG